VNARTTTHYSPFYQYAPALTGIDGSPGATWPAPAPFAIGAVANPNVVLEGDTELVSHFTKRTDFSIGVGATKWWFLDFPENDVATASGHLGVRHRLTRPLSLHLGYGRELVGYNYPGAVRTPNDTIDAGVDYNDALTFSRRTTLSFGASTSALHTGDEIHYRINGSLLLTRGFKRTWQATAGYFRSSDFLPAYREPVLEDRAELGVSGMFLSRLQWSAGAAYARGTVGFDTGDRIESSSASTTLGFSITRFLGVSCQYRFYHYGGMRPGLSPFDFQERQSRQVFAVGLNAWFPILNKTKTATQGEDRQ